MLYLLCVGQGSLGQTLASDRLAGTKILHEALIAVPRPNLAQTEKTTRLILEQARANLENVIRDGVEKRKLAAEFGEMGMLYHSHLVFEPAIACYRNAMRLANQDYRWPYYLGYLQQQNGRLKQAADAYQASLRLEPDTTITLLRLGLIYLELGELERAEPLLRSAAAVPDFAGAALFGLGRLALAQRRFEPAAEWLLKALEFAPKASRIHYTLSLAYRALKKPEPARFHLQRRGDQAPRFPDPLVSALDALTTGQGTVFHYAMDAIYRGEYPLATELFRNGLELEPNNQHARISLARALYLTGARKQARIELDRVLKQQPHHPLANFLLGLMYQENGHTDQAMARLRLVLETDPYHAGAHFSLGNMLLQAGAFGQASHHYARSLEAEPANHRARLREILALIQAHTPDAIILQHLESALAKEPGDPDLIYLLTELLAASRDNPLRDGQRALAMAKALFDNQPSVENRRLLAMAYAETGRFQLADQLQREALQMAISEHKLDLLPDLLTSLNAYQAHQPCRSPWAASVVRSVLPPPNTARVFKDYPADAPY